MTRVSPEKHKVTVSGFLNRSRLIHLIIKKHLGICITFLFSVFTIIHSYAQAENGTSLQNHMGYWKPGFKQIGESANFGLVFSGPEAIYGHYWEYVQNCRILSVESEIGVCIPFSKSIPALDIYFKPAELSYLFQFRGKTLFAAGPLLKFEYNYTLYPQLQSAFDYWFTNFSFGIKTMYNFKITGHSLSARLNFSICGFTSRQPLYRNPYFYDIGFKHAVKHLNTDLRFSTLEEYNTSNFELHWKSKTNTRITWAYCLEYSGYFKAPEITIVSHSIKLMFNPKSK
jgi:hypothetical protein